MTKAEVVALVEVKKQEAMASFDAIIAAIQSIPEDSGELIAELQAQLAAAQSALSDAQAALVVAQAAVAVKQAKIDGAIAVLQQPE